MNFLTEKQNREIEDYAISKNLNLIENASDEVVKLVKKEFDKKIKVLVIAGSGNNGSDAIATAIKLINKDYKIDLYRFAEKGNESNEVYYHEYCQLKQPLRKLPKVDKYDVVIDGLFGIGLDRALQGEVLDVIKTINEQSKYTIAIDVPSGLGAFDAKIYGIAIEADKTITFLADKQGLHTSAGLDYAGKVIVSELIKADSIKLSKSDYEVYKNKIKDINLDNILRKKKNTNKGTYGNLAIIGGSTGMNGSLQLAGTSALYSGCGKVSMISLDSNFRADMSMPELMTKPLENISKSLNTFSALTIGVGFDTNTKSKQAFEQIIDSLKQPAIFDADGLNIIAENEEVKQKFIKLKNKVITPHPAEAARLLNCTTQEIVLPKKYKITGLRL